MQNVGCLEGEIDLHPSMKVSRRFDPVSGHHLHYILPISVMLIISSPGHHLLYTLFAHGLTALRGLDH